MVIKTKLIFETEISLSFENNVPFDNSTPIYLINMLWKLGLGFGLDSELHYFSIIHRE